MDYQVSVSLERTDEFAVLENLVSDNGPTVEQALQKIIDLTMVASAQHPHNPAQGHGLVDYRVSQSILELAQRLEPARHIKLVAFLIALQKQTATNPATGEPLKCQDGNALWTDLPSFGYSEVEEYYGDAYKDPHDPHLDIEKKQRWSRLNAFLAQLTQATDIEYATPDSDDGVVRWRPTDKSPRAIWTFSTAFEAETELSLLAQARSSAVWAACEWFIHASDKLWEQVQHNRKFTVNEGPGPKYSSKDWTGFERDRWDAWEDALKEIGKVCDADASDLDETVKQKVHDALESIKRAKGGQLLKQT